MSRSRVPPYEDGSRALCIAHWPKRFAPRRKSAIAMYCDIVPTLIDMAGGHSRSSLDGRSLKSLWLGERETHRESVFISNVHPFWLKAIVTERYKLIWTGFPETDPICGNSSAADKYFSRPWIEWNERAKSDHSAALKVERVLHPIRYELYDVQTDPYEVNDLSSNSEYRYLKAELLVLLKNLMVDSGESLDSLQY